MTNRHFVIIGSMKSGTTSLYQHLLGHPEIGMSRMKETDYFIDKMNFELGQAWYENQFPKDRAVTGEASPNYTSYDIFPRVPQHMVAYNPDTKLIFLARDPVDRFVSHYRHSLIMGHCDVQPADLLADRQGAHMIESSRYYAQLQQFLAVFPREQLLILDFAALVRDPQSVMDQVTDFIGVDRLAVGGIATKNDAASIASMPKGLQRLWRSRFMRRLDPLISREMRDTARRILSRGSKAPVLPTIPDSLRTEAAALLRADATEFRKLSGYSFPDWSV